MKNTSLSESPQADDLRAQTDDLRAQARKVLGRIAERYGSENLSYSFDEKGSCSISVSRVIELEDSRLFSCFFKVYLLVSKISSKAIDEDKKIEIAWTIFKDFWQKECWGLVEAYIKTLEYNIQHPPISDQPNIASDKSECILAEHRRLFLNPELISAHIGEKIWLETELATDRTFEEFAKKEGFDLTRIFATTPGPNSLVAKSDVAVVDANNKVVAPDCSTHYRQTAYSKEDQQQQQLAQKPAKSISPVQAVAALTFWTVVLTGTAAFFLTPKQTSRRATVALPNLPVNRQPPTYVPTNLSANTIHVNSLSPTCTTQSVSMVSLSFRFNNHRHIPPCGYDESCKTTLQTALNTDRRNRENTLFHCPTQTCTWSSTATANGSNVVIQVTDSNTGSGNNRHGSRRFQVTVTTCSTIDTNN